MLVASHLSEYQRSANSKKRGKDQCVLLIKKGCATQQGNLSSEINTKGGGGKRGMFAGMGGENPNIQKKKGGAADLG